MASGVRKRQPAAEGSASPHLARRAAAPPHPVDACVGLAVRELRKARGRSQAELARAIGLTFQQVQKYERGANRISASKLVEIGAFLDAPVACFFDGLPGQRAAIPPLACAPDANRSGEAARIALRLGLLPRRRRRLVGLLIEAMAEASSRPQPDSSEA